MEPSLRSMLRRGCMSQYFEIDHSFKEASTIRGFIVDYSDTFLLVHALDFDSFQLNGYKVVRTADAESYGIATRGNWILKAIKHFRLKPIRPQRISLESDSDLLKSIALRHPLITFHPERKDPDIYYVGSLLAITPQTATIDDLDSNCKWTGPRRLNLADITRIDFGDRYTEALAAAALSRFTHLRLSRRL